MDAEIVSCTNVQGSNGVTTIKVLASTDLVTATMVAKFVRRNHTHPVSRAVKQAIGTTSVLFPQQLTGKGGNLDLRVQGVPRELWRVRTLERNLPRPRPQLMMTN